MHFLVSCPIPSASFVLVLSYSYPAGFVYIYAGLYWVTDQGQNILRAQAIFGLIYLLNTCIVLRIYTKVAQVCVCVCVVSVICAFICYDLDFA